MNILILALNARFSHSCLAGYILKNKLLDNELPARLLECTINDLHLAIIQKVIAIRPTHILIPLYIWNIEALRPLIIDLRALLPSTVFIGGGPHAVCLAQGQITDTLFDLVVLGECEEIIVPLFSRDIERLPATGAGYLPVIKAGPIDFAAQGFAYTSQDLAALGRRIAYYESMRGCPFHCAYCLSGNDNERKRSVQFRNLNQVFKELDAFLAHPPGMVKFVDRTFNCHKEHSRGIWQYLAELPADAPPLSFQFELHPELLDDDDLHLLKNIAPGRVQLEIGIQSTNPDVLKASGRRQQAKWPVLAQRLKNMNRLDNIRIHLDQIAGLPGSDLAEAYKTMNDILATRPGHFQLGFLKLLPGTRLYRERESHEYLASVLAPHQVLKSKWMTIEDFAQLQKIEWGIDVLYNSANFRYTLDYLLQDDCQDFFLAIHEQHQTLDAGLAARQWKDLAASILKIVAQHSRETVRELMMLDWCQRAPGYLYPEGIGAPGRRVLEEQRLDIWQALKAADFRAMPTGFSMRVFNRSPFFNPQSPYLLELLGPGPFLFVPVNDGSRIRISLEPLFRAQSPGDSATT